VGLEGGATVEDSGVVAQHGSGAVTRSSTAVETELTFVSLALSWIATVAGSKELIGAVTGFLVGWGTSELTDLRRRRTTRRAIRRAIVAELYQVESLLSILVLKFSYGTPNVARAVVEMRWLVEVGAKRGKYAGVPEPDEEQRNLMQQFAGRSVDEIAAIIRALPPMQENRAFELHLPVVTAVLAAPGSGFNGDEIQALSAVAWQAYLLSEEARWMEEFVRLSYTVSDPGNHQVIAENHARCKVGYRQRAEMALDVVRVALRALTDDSPVDFTYAV
jgi:hypothetical protein